jgi:hypothetical protein
MWLFVYNSLDESQHFNPLTFDFTCFWMKIMAKIFTSTHLNDPFEYFAMC